MSVRTSVVLSLTLMTAVLATGAAWLLLGDISALAATGAPALPGAEGAGGGGSAAGWGYLAAALATGLSSLAAGYAVAHIGSAAVGAIMEKPEMLGRVLILVGLGEGIAIYGLIISILILNRIG